MTDAAPAEGGAGTPDCITHGFSFAFGYFFSLHTQNRQRGGGTIRGTQPPQDSWSHRLVSLFLSAKFVRQGFSPEGLTGWSPHVFSQAKDVMEVLWSSFFFLFLTIAALPAFFGKREKRTDKEVES